MTSVDGRTQRFWALVAPLLAQGRVERGTLMGFDCVRCGGGFLATTERATGDLIVKLDAERVSELLGKGLGEAFAPAGRTFKEWVRVRDDATWSDRIDEGIAIAESRNE